MAHSNSKILGCQETQDLLALEKSTTKSEDQVGSSAEVVSEHGRTHNLLHTEHGGYCMNNS